jgi:hypothetical protein
MMTKCNLYNAVSCVNSYNYSTWKLIAWWPYTQSGVSYRCNPEVDEYKC